MPPSIPTTMKQLTMLKESLVNGLRGLYVTECKLSITVSHISNSTENQSLKAEFVVYLESLRRNIKEIERIFCLLKETVALPVNPTQVESLNYSSFFNTPCREEEASGSFIRSLQQIIECKMFLYRNVYRLASNQNLPKVAFILHEIFEFEQNTFVILNDIPGCNMKSRCASR